MLTSYHLPHELKLLTISTSGHSHYGVFCGHLTIKDGTRFGPYTGRIVCPEEMNFGSLKSESLWEVCSRSTLKFLRDFCSVTKTVPLCANFLSFLGLH